MARVVDRLQLAARAHGWSVTDLPGSTSLLFDRGGAAVYVICDALGRVATVRAGDQWLTGPDQADTVLAILTAPGGST